MSSLGHRKQDNLNSISNILIPNGTDKAFSQTFLPPFCPTSQVASTQPYTLTIYAQIPEHNTELFQKRERNYKPTAIPFTPKSLPYVPP